MANEKTFQSRIQLKHDTEAHWQLATGFTPKAGEMIVYDADANNPVRYKIGDGTTNVNALPFATGTAVLYTSQDIDEDQQKQALINLGLSTEDIEGLKVIEAITADKVAKKLTVGSKTYDGSTNVSIDKSDVGLGNVTNESKATMFTNPAFTGTPTAPTAANTVDNTQIATTAFVHNVVDALSAADLGLEQAMKFLGTTTTDISDASDIDTIIIGSGTVRVEAGNVVLYNGYEYVWTGSAWEQLGQEGSFVLKSITINGKALNDNITLTASDVDAYSKAEIDTALSSKSDTGHTHSLADINEVEVTTNTETVYEETVTANSNITTVSDFPFKKVRHKKAIVTLNGVEYDGEYSISFEGAGYENFKFGDYTISQPLAEGYPTLRPTIAGETYEIKVDVIETTTIIPDDYISENIVRTSELDALQTVVAGKADSSTTLAGYGITDAYTKTEVDTAIVNSKNIWYGTCPYENPTVTVKDVTTSSGDFKLEAGNVIYVQFTYQANLQAALNVDGTGAKAIKTIGTNDVDFYYWSPNETVGFVYDGTYFRMIDSQIATTTYYGMTILSSSTSSIATDMAATPSAVKAAYDLANSKADPSTTLAGYGITDAYTKAEIDAMEFITVADIDAICNASIVAATEVTY